MTKPNEDGIPMPDPELMKKWREKALKDLPSREDFANLIAYLRWASELDRIGAANKDLPDRLTSVEYTLRTLLAFFSKIPVLMEKGHLAPLMRLEAAIVDLAAGRKSDLFEPVLKKPGRPENSVTHSIIQAIAARALAELFDGGEPIKQASDRVAAALKKGRRDMKDVTGATVRNWRARLEEGLGARGVEDAAVIEYLKPLPLEWDGASSKARGETLLKAFRENGEALG